MSGQTVRRLGWLTEEVEVNLARGLDALQAFLDDPGDISRLRQCLDYIHQVQGSLEVAGASGAGRLAREAEQLLRAMMAPDGVPSRREALDILARVLGQIPAYLHQMIASGTEDTASLIVLVNDLRAVKGEPLVSGEADLFPELSIPAPAAGGPRITPGPDLVRKLRSSYHQALVGLFKGQSIGDHCRSIERVFSRLRELGRGTEQENLWWAASAFAEGLFYHRIALSPATRQLLRDLDGAMRTVANAVPEGVPGGASRTLLTHLLFYIAHCGAETPRILAVVRDFGLDGALVRPWDEGWQGRRLPDRETVHALTEGLYQEVDTIKELVEECVAQSEVPLSTLEQIRLPVARLSSTLRVVGNSLLESRVAALEEWLATYPGSAATPDFRGTDRLAELVVELESAVGAWGMDGQRDRSAVDLPEDQRLEVNKAWGTLIGELQAAVEQIKGLVIDFLAGDTRAAALEALPSRAAQAAGALRLADMPEAASCLDDCAGFVEKRLSNASSPPSEPELEALAEVLSTVEHYLEEIAAGAGERETGSLQLATAAQDTLVRAGRGNSSSPDTEEPSTEVSIMKPTKETSSNGKPEADTGTEIDPEIREIFVEEAREVLDTLDESFPAWRADSDDNDALTTTRRAFHTLKGSGRMVGAEQVGELAWAVENMLNRVIDGRVGADETVKQCVADTLALVPTMVAAFEGGNSDYDAAEAQRLEALAHSLTAGEVPESTTAEGDQVATGTPVGDSAEQQGTAEEQEEIDPALVQIFTGEARVHFDTVEEFVETQRRKAPFYDHPTSRLQAALHTLKGSAHMASIGPVAELVTPLERLVKEMLNFQIPVDEDVVELLSDSRAYCLAAIDSLERGEPCDTEEQALLVARVAELRERKLGPVLGQEEVEAPAVDPAFLNLLMAEGMQAVFDAEHYLGDAPGQERLTAMAGELRQLQDGATRAGMPAMATLSDRLATAYEQVAAGEARVAGEALATLIEGHNQLLDMADAVAANQDLAEPDPALLERIEAVPGVVSAPSEAIASAGGHAAEETGTGESEASAPPPAADALEGADKEVVGLFLDEADELLEGIEQAFESWRQEPGDSQHPEELKRLLHTFKGGARMADLTELGESSHELETLVMEQEEAVIGGDTAPLADMLARQDQLVAGIAEIRRQLRGAASAEATPAASTPQEAPSRPEEPAPTWSGAEILPFTGTYKGLDPASQATARENQEAAQEMVRVSAQMLDDLVNMAGETSISRSQVEQNISEFMYSLDEMEATIRRMHDQVRRLSIETDAQVNFRREQIEASEHEEGFDPLEMDRYSQLQQLSRSLVESASDLQDLRDTLVDKSRDAESILLQQSRINTDLQEGLMRTRMVPFSRLVPRLRRVVRQVGNTLGKEVNFDLGNVEGELDRNVLERILPPLEHMIRNALDHGLETREEREQQGKPGEGTLSLSFAREGGDVLIRIADDGRGLNIEGIREKAFSKGLLIEDAQYSDNEIAQFIFHPGFSTSEEVSQTSGRGVGMDVVNSEVKQLGGVVSMTTRAGVGTEFQVRLPFTVSVNRALMIELGEDFYALALNSISGVTRLSQEDLMHYYQNPGDKLEYAGEFYEVRYLGTLLSRELRPNLDTALGQVPLVLIRGDERNFAVQVDALIGSQEVVVKTLGSHFSRVPGLSGATVLGDGRVVVILDLQNLLRDQAAATVLTPELPDEKPDREPELEESGVQTIMVVDDSVTVRKVTGRFLEREGFRVLTAKDGVDAMRMLQDNTPDLMLLDIEMPRMDGFEVTRLVRSTQRLKDLPIIMITSRTGEKHRERALDMGVNAYLGKPYQEEMLIEQVYNLLTAADTG